MAYDHFHGIDLDGKIPTHYEPIRMLGITSKITSHIIIVCI